MPTWVRLASLALGLLVAGAGCGTDPTSVVPVDGGADIGPPFFQQIDEPDGGLAGQNWFAVHGSSSTNVVMVGQGGAIARWNGVTLGLEPSGTTADLRGVFVVDKDSAFAVGAGGTIVRYDKGTWTPYVARRPVAPPDGGAPPDLAFDSDGGVPSDVLFNGVWSDGKRTIAVGARGAVFGFDTAPYPIATDTGDDFMAISADRSGPIAVGTLGMTARFQPLDRLPPDPNALLRREVLAGYPNTLTTVAPTPAHGVWLGGVSGKLYRLDDNTDIAGVPAVVVRGVAQAGSRTWVVGFDSLVASVSGIKVAVFSDVPARWYESVWAASDTDVWIVGNAGVILRSRPPAPPDAGVSDGGRG